MPSVFYTDPAWAVDPAGRLDPALATVEREVFGDQVEIRFGPRGETGYALDGEELHARAAGVDAVVVYRCQVTPRLLAAAGDGCRVVARQGVGLDNLNIPLLREAGRFGFHVPDYCGDEVSTHALALLLALERGVCVQNEAVKSDNWGIYRGGLPRRTATATAGIVGFGRIGRAVARKLQAFYGRVLAYDPHVPADLMAAHGVTHCAELEELLAASDAVLLHAELTPQSRGLINARSARAFKPGSLLVNAARGALVELPAVAAALDDGRLGGFASDVFSPEDPNRDPMAAQLLKRDDVVVSSHRAFLSAQSEASLRRRIAEDVLHVLRTGEPPRSGRVA
ncbi:C-terminal binding protein [Kitasatospora sp. NPDC094011]|uniref:C-terminal binding protein n=1 Tax=Kitasatospora sp. NPDC094011 TaxID=3364090 RepID=UPI003805572D